MKLRWLVLDQRLRLGDNMMLALPDFLWGKCAVQCMFIYYSRVNAC